MGDVLFISGSFSGLSGELRRFIIPSFQKHGIEILVKNGYVEESTSSLMDRSDGMIFVIGAHESAIEDVWGRKLVDLELSYAKHKNLPVLPIMLDIDDSEPVSRNVLQIRKEIKDQFKEDYIKIDEVRDYMDRESMKKEYAGFDDDKVISIFRKISRVCHVGWQKKAKVFNNNKVFISYSTKDKDIALRIHDKLEENGLLPWIDRNKIAVGRDLTDTISKAIEACGFIVVLLSKESVKSDWVAQEVALALEKEKDYADRLGNIIIPVLIDDCQLPDNLAFLKDRLWVPITSDDYSFDESMDRLCQSIKDQKY